MNYFDVVADSEGEELEFGSSKAAKAFSSIEIASGSGPQCASSIVAATSWTTTPHGNQECDASTSARMLDMDFPGPFSIADRAKTRQRSTQRHSLSTPGPSSRVPHPFDGDSLFESYHVPDTHGEDDSDGYTVPHPKPKQKKPAEVWDNPDSLYDAKVGYDSNPAVPAAEPSGRGQSSFPPAQSRPKPRPIKRSPKVNVDPPSVDEPTTNNNQERQPTLQPSLPVPTSPLPPSDPPPPTSTILNDHCGSMPPIVTLPDPPSSPSSLFSIGDKDVGFADDAHIPSVDDDPLLMGPPSTFFTGSSSPDQPALPQKPISKPKFIEAIDIIDLCTAPPQSTDVQVLAVKKASSSKKGKEKEPREPRGADKSKSKAKGKRKARDEDEFGFYMGDDDDDEYEEAGKGKKAKAAAAKRAREKKAAASKKAIPDVTIDSRPRSTTKAPGKAMANEVPDRQDGKSRDDEPEHQPLIPTLRNKAPDRLPDLSVAVSNPGEPQTPPNFVPDSEGENVMDNVAGPRNPLATPGSGAKKRRNDVTGDEDKAGEPEKEESSSPKKKARTRFRTQAKVKNNSTQPEENRGRQARQKGKRVVSSDEEEDEFNGDALRKKSRQKATAVLSSDQDEAAEDDSIKENVRPGSGSSVGSALSSSSKPKPPSPKSSPITTHSNDNASAKPVTTSLTSRYTIAPRTKSTPMSELIKRVNSLPQTPSPAGKDRTPSALRTASGMAYSPYAKASRSFLSRIAPLHPNRRTPPPPPPPPPPRKKSKKEIEREERWEEEMIENVGGPAAWSCLPEEDRKEMRRAKWAMEMGVDD